MERCCWDEGRAVAVEKRKKKLLAMITKIFPAISTYGSAKLIASSCATFLLRFFKPKVSGCSDRMPGIVKHSD